MRVPAGVLWTAVGVLAMTVICGLGATSSEGAPAAAASARAEAGGPSAGVLVSFKSGVASHAARAAAKQAGAAVVERLSLRAISPGRDLYLARSSSLSTADLVRRLATDPLVARVEPDFVLRTDATVPDDPLLPSLWGMARIAAPAAWDRTTGLPSVIVADIDTGVRYEHPDLAANMWHNPQEWGGSPGVDDDGNGYVDDVYGIDSTAGDTDPLDEDATNSHGTHVAGIIAAAGDNGIGVAGVSWNTKIMALKCFDANGAGSVSQSIECIDYAVWQKQHGVNVVAINASWGGDAPSAFLRYAIDAAGEAGIVFVAAAGNTARDNDVTPHYPSSYESRNILAVANSTQTDARRITSCWGPASVDLAAPGTDILSTVGTATDASGYTTLTGTSMAAPHVSGTIALCAALYPSEGVEARIDRVLRGVDLLPDWTSLCASGGRLNADGALSVQAPTDDDIPGLRLHASPATGAVSASGDTIDVYRVRLQGGRTLQADVVGPAGSNLDLHLLGPATPTVDDLDAALASAAAAAYPDRLCYETPAAGDGTYYLAVVAKSGGGEYDLSFSVGVNDTLAGAAALIPSPATGDLTAATDTHDVWKLQLASGQVLQANLTGPAGADFRLALYAPWASGFDPGALLAAAAGGAYPRMLARQATEHGDFFLDASAVAGAGAYRLAYTVTTVADNEIPGVPLPASPVSGSVTTQTDLSDVYAVHLDAGEVFGASVDGTAGSNVDLYLFGPDATHVWNDPATEYATGDTYPDALAYAPPAGGTFYLMVRERAGSSAAYTLTWTGGDSQPDTTPPVTTASGVLAGWSRTPVVVTLAADDDLSGVAVTQYRIAGTPTWTTYDGPFVAGTPGATDYRYRSVDEAGNEEPERSVIVRVDPTGPRTAALSRVVTKRGKKATFAFRVTDLTPTARVTIKVYLGKKLKQRFALGARPTGSKQNWTWRRCSLARGTYTWKVYAVDQALNPQTRLGTARLIVR